MGFNSGFKGLNDRGDEKLCMRRNFLFGTPGQNLFELSNGTR